MQAPNPQPIAIPVPQAIQSLEPTKLKPPARVTAIAAGGDHSMAVTVGGTLLAFGANKHGQLGTGDTLDRMVPTEVRWGLLLRGRVCACWVGVGEVGEWWRNSCGPYVLLLLTAHGAGCSPILHAVPAGAAHT